MAETNSNISSAAYAALTKAVTDAEAKLDAALAKLKTLQDDPLYKYNLSRTTDSRIIGDPSAWINSSGAFYNHTAQSTTDHNNGFKVVADQEKKIADQQKLVDAAKTDLANAEINAGHYEKNSTVALSQQAAASNKKYMIIAGAILGLMFLVIISILVFKKSKPTPAAA